MSTGPNDLLIDSEMAVDPIEADELSGDAVPTDVAEAVARGARFVARMAGVTPLYTPALRFRIGLQATFFPPPGADFVLGSLCILLRKPDEARVLEIEPDSLRVAKSATPTTREIGAAATVHAVGVQLTGKVTSVGGQDAIVIQGVTGGRDASWNFYEDPFTSSGLSAHYNLAFVSSPARMLQCDISATGRLRMRDSAGVVDRLVNLILPGRRFQATLALPVTT